MYEIQTHPFPHAVIEDWWPDQLLNDVLEEFREAEQRHPILWKHFTGQNEEKYEGGPHLFGEETRRLVQMIRDKGPRLAQAFNLPPLNMELVGGGYHLIRPGGLLNVHSDFSVSPITGHYRRLNLLVYLNHDWDLYYNGGGLELWDDDRVKAVVTPEFNTTAIFQTSARSWHGHPKPVRGRARRSLAAYFYSEEPPPDFTNQDTVWHPKAPQVK